MIQHKKYDNETIQLKIKKKKMKIFKHNKSNLKDYTKLFNL